MHYYYLSHTFIPPPPRSFNHSAKGTLKYGYQSRVLMTGTPLQNNIQELWTLLNFIGMFSLWSDWSLTCEIFLIPHPFAFTICNVINAKEPSIFPSLEEFDEKFANMANREQVENLQRKISPFMLRRVSAHPPVLSVSIFSSVVASCHV